MKYKAKEILPRVYWNLLQCRDGDPGGERDKVKQLNGILEEALQKNRENDFLFYKKEMMIVFNWERIIIWYTADFSFVEIPKLMDLL